MFHVSSPFSVFTAAGVPGLVLCLLLPACAPDSEPEAVGPVAVEGGTALIAYDEEVRALVDRMTLAEKIGQMTQAELTGLEDPSDVGTLFLGSVLSGGGADPEAGNSLEAWADAVDALHRYALNTRLGIPLLYGVDAVHGHNNVLGAVVFPHNIGLGATRNAALVEEINRITAEEVRATGVTCRSTPRTWPRWRPSRQPAFRSWWCSSQAGR